MFYQKLVLHSKSVQKLNFVNRRYLISITGTPRGMLQENLTSENLDVAISETKKAPDFLNIHHALKLQKSGGFPEVNWRSFWIKNDEGKRVDFVSRAFSLPGYVLNFLFLIRILHKNR